MGSLLVSENSNKSSSILEECIANYGKEDMIKLFPYKYDINLKSWITISDVSTPILDNKEISFITYNIWFERHNWTNRLYSITNILQSFSPDFICLQEVTDDSLKYLMEQTFIKENYCISSSYQKGYYVIMLSKCLTNFYLRILPSYMGRKLVLTELLIPNKENGKDCPILISTAHFESLNNQYMRKIQLKCAFDILNLSSLSFLMGDFNFDSSWVSEQANIDNSYIDVWSLHEKKNNLTYENGYTMAKSDEFPAWRPDRILFKDFHKKLQLEIFEIIGKTDIPINYDENSSKITTPSDHYGLYSKFLIKE